MENQEPLRVWIYCRISDKQNIDLLYFQADILEEFADENNFLILGFLKEIDDGIYLNSRSLAPVINAIKDDFIDAILVYSKDRILCNIDTYTEFELLCLMHNVSIITYDEYI